MTSRAFPTAANAFHRRLAWIFGLQMVAVVAVCLLGMYGLAPAPLTLLLIVAICVLTWLVTRRQWKEVRWLARAVKKWDEHKPDLGQWQPGQLPRQADADVAVLAQGLYTFASRIAGYNQRERNFTRDASHELRSPLTVIKMSADMLADELALGEFGQRSVQRIKRATREMEALVEALLILARESDNGLTEEDFVVNDVLERELIDARELLEGQPITLRLDEPARFALHGSPRVFAVLCWQLIRNACQQAEQGTVVITVLPGAVTVTNAMEADTYKADRHGFELAIAQRISERFAWPLELQTRDGKQHIARIRFPKPLPANV
ncbi:sensor histidine kinase [Dyella koreensis]|uniref:histidine kinase n=1 Tax=Dyella koreensis TaxID=311235 RepID=A0ABW8K5S5_9GAMM